MLSLGFASLLAGGLVPQRIATSAADMEKWRNAHHLLLPLVERFGIFHVFSTPWFALLLFMICVSLALSSLEQFKAAYRKTFSSLHPAEPDTLALHVTAEALKQELRQQGYVQLGGTGVLRFVRQPWGYWSNFLLHSGMLLVIASSLFVALTQQRGSLTLAEGETHGPQEPWVDEERGELASSFILPMTVRLDRFRIDDTGKKSAQQASSDISFISPKGVVDKRSVAINAILHYQGLRIYQSTNYGDAFTVEITVDDGTNHYERLPIPYPTGPDQAGYNDFRLPWLSYTLSTKYFADADMKTMDGTNPLLFLRLLDGKREISRISLKRGESGRLGDMKVRLVKVERWTNLIFVNISGMPFIFLGFFIVVLGTVLNYMTVPREFIARKTDGGYCVNWRAAKFADFYADEFKEILEKLSAGEGE